MSEDSIRISARRTQREMEQAKEAEQCRTDVTRLSMEQATFDEVLQWKTEEGDKLLAAGVSQAALEQAFSDWWRERKERS